MRFLIDTCIVSELIKPSPNASVVEWFRETDELDVAMSVMTLGELQKGIDRLAAGKRRRQLVEFLDDIQRRFEHRLLPVTVEVARRWGTSCAEALARGTALSGIDALVAATALVNGLIVVTRNVRDFEPIGVRVLDPFAS